jgi:DNA-binding HxlR family transcriptional regulator
MKTKNLSQDAEPLYDSQYPARQVLQIIADTWTPIVLFCVRGRTRRFNELGSVSLTAARALQNLRSLIAPMWVMGGRDAFCPEFLVTACRTPRCW